MKVVFLVLLLLLVVPMANAIDTEIHVKTKPFHSVNVLILQPTEAYNLIKSYNFETITGEETITYSGSEAKVGIQIVVERDEKKVFAERFDNYKTGSDLYFVLLDDEINGGEEPFVSNEVTQELSYVNGTEVSNETIETQEIVSQQNETTQELNESLITGNVVAQIPSLEIKGLSYYVGGILLIAIILGFFVMRGISGQKSVRRSNFKEKPMDLDKELEDAERRIKEAQQEISEIKKQRSTSPGNKESLISEAEARLRRDQDILKRLRED